MNRILAALLIASCISFSTAPAAEAGRIRDAVRRAGEKVALKGLCVIDKLSPGGGKNFFCK
jgi:hypothetical protein